MNLYEIGGAHGFTEHAFPTVPPLILTIFQFRIQSLTKDRNYCHLWKLD